MFRIIILLLISIVAGPSLNAQGSYADQVRNLVREKLIFYYIDDPTQPKPSDMSTIEIDKNAIAEGRDINSPVWTDARNLGFRQLLVDLLCSTEEGKGGDFRLQRITRDALLLTNKKVAVYLYNDSANGLPHTTWEDNTIYCQYDENDNTKNQCWPCASRFDNRTKDLTGHMALGAHYLNPSSNRTIDDAREKTSTFLHELVHTQVEMVKESSVSWANWYGADGSGHASNEILPSKNTAFNEGVATAFAFRLQLSSEENAVSWFNNNQVMWVDSIGGCGTGGTPSYRCIMDRLAAAGQPGRRAVTTSGRIGKIYNIRDVPAEILMHNETVLANMIHEYGRQYRNPLILVRDLKRALTNISACTGDEFTFMPLYKEMMRTSQRWQPLNTPEGRDPKGEILTAGIADFYLGFGLSNRAALETALGTTWPADMPDINPYFNTHRATLQGLRPNTTTWDVSQLETFAERMDVHQRRPAAAASRSATNN